jgi:phage terminase small subunit
MRKQLPTSSHDLPAIGREPTDLQKHLVEILVAAEDDSGISITQAAVNAGYQGGREAARVSATKALQQPHVQEYLQRRLRDVLKVGAVGAAATLVRLSTEAKSEYVRMNAAAAVLDRAGLTKPDQSVQVNAGELIVNIDLS